jgi:hypothetical protein
MATRPASPTARELDEEDRKLLALVTEALADPNLDAQPRERLRAQIFALLNETHEWVYGAPSTATPPIADPAVTGLLEGLLADPDLHTDTRMRLYREISELVLSTHRHP